MHQPHAGTSRDQVVRILLTEKGDLEDFKVLWISEQKILFCVKKFFFFLNTKYSLENKRHFLQNKRLS